MGLLKDKKDIQNYRHRWEAGKLHLNKKDIKSCFVNKRHIVNRKPHNQMSQSQSKDLFYRHTPIIFQGPEKNFQHTPDKKKKYSPDKNRDKKNKTPDHPRKYLSDKDKKKHSKNGLLYT